jgi:putative membrane protein
MELSFGTMLGYVVLGTLLASLLSVLPGLHIYNVAAIVLMIYMGSQGLIPLEALPVFMMSMIVAYAILSTIPSVLLGAPDESAIFIVLPGMKYMMQGRAYEGAVLTAAGGLLGILVLVALTPLAFRIIPAVMWMLAPHMFWILAAVLAFMVMSEWPKAGTVGKTPWKRFFAGWANLGAGILTLLLSGLLGLIVLSRGLVPEEVGFQGLMPIFVGLFAVPWVLTNILSHTEVPPQKTTSNLDVGVRHLAVGTMAGALGGYFAALFPMITGGIGSLLAGHATAQRDDRVFIISQGSSRVIYYVGAFLIFFVPGIGITRGGLALMLRMVYQPASVGEYWMVLSAMLLSAGLSFAMLLLLCRALVKFITHYDYRIASWITLVIMVGMIGGLFGLKGLLIMLVSAAIGMIPVMFGSRRINCMGVLLIPIILDMAGLGWTARDWLGLL